MKIAYVYDLIYPYVKGGAEKRFWELARIMASRGHEVHMYGMRFWSGEADIVKEGVHIHGISFPSVSYLRTGLRDPGQVIRFSWAVFGKFRKERFDIVDCNAFPFLPFFPLHFLSLKGRFCLVITLQEVWGNYWYKYLGPLFGVIGRLVESIVLSSAGNVILHSLTVKKKYLQLGNRKSLLELIPNGIDLGLINRVKPSSHDCDAIFAGRLVAHKHVDVLVKSLALVKDRLPGVKALIIGQGSESGKITDLAHNLGLGGNLQLCDFMEYQEMLALLKAAKVFVFPSSREGFGIAALEAMACGLPVITVKEPLNASVELVSQGVNGLLCELDEKSISEGLLEVLNDPEKRARMSQAAKDGVSGFDWEDVATANENFYRKLIK